jgi:hypothetical protein
MLEERLSQLVGGSENGKRMVDATGGRDVGAWAFHSPFIRVRFVSKPRHPFICGSLAFRADGDKWADHGPSS